MYVHVHEYVPWRMGVFCVMGVFCAMGVFCVMSFACTVTSTWLLNATALTWSLMWGLVARHVYKPLWSVLTSDMTNLMCVCVKEGNGRQRRENGGRERGKEGGVLNVAREEEREEGRECKCCNMCKCTHSLCDLYMYMYIHVSVHVRSVISTRHCKASTPEDNSFSLEKKSCLR